MSAPLAIVINPVSGTGGRPALARRRAEVALSFCNSRGLAPEIVVTEHTGHARDLTRALLHQGVRLFVGWGGDGTVNEMGTALALTGVPLAIVPSGSGNGLARELRIPRRPLDALRIAIDGDERQMDAGEIEGRWFFNVAGIGLDARVAHRFATTGLERRGFRRYLEIAFQELLARRAEDLTVDVDGASIRSRVLLAAIANSRQYGNGAIIAPAARIDDGLLDLVMVGARSPVRALMQAPRLFLGQLGRVGGVLMKQGKDIRIHSDGALLVHVDGEPFMAGNAVEARIRPGALRVRVPHPR